MVAVGGFAEDFVEQVRGAVDHQVLVRERRGRVDAAQDLEHPQAVERAVGLVHGAEDLHGALASRFVAFVHRQAGAEDALGVADVAGGHQLVAGLDAQVEIAGGLFREGDAEGLGFFGGSHGEVFRRGIMATNGAAPSL